MTDDKDRDDDYGASPWQWVREQVDVYENSAGEKANTLRDTGLAVIVVTHRGRKTGKVRKTPLMRVEHDGEYLLVGSMGGAPKNPVWVYNLRDLPDEVLVQDGPEPFPVTIREIDGEEKAVWWKRAVEAFPPYADYQARTSRQIPVFVATPKR